MIIRQEDDLGEQHTLDSKEFERMLVLLAVCKCKVGTASYKPADLGLKDMKRNRLAD